MSTQLEINHPEESGFTLVELLMVITILGIVTYTISTKFFSPSETKALAFSSQVGSLIQYAQSSAINKNRTICVQYSTQAIQIKLSSLVSTASAGVPACDIDLANDPNGLANSTLAIPNGITIETNNVQEIRFDNLGRPYAEEQISSASSTNFMTIPLIWIINETHSITVEPLSGIVEVE